MEKMITLQFTEEQVQSLTEALFEASTACGISALNCEDNDPLRKLNFYLAKEYRNLLQMIGKQVLEQFGGVEDE